jgi:hypothetical protein
MGSKSQTQSPVSWQTICQSDLYRGRWVALDAVRYDPASAQPLEGEVVDADEDLAELCARMRAADRTACAIVFCEPEPVVMPFTRRGPVQQRAVQG